MMRKMPKILRIYAWYYANEGSGWVSKTKKIVSTAQWIAKKNKLAASQ